MSRHAFALASVTLIASACAAHAPPEPRVATSAHSTKTDGNALASTKHATPGPTDTDTTDRKLGDFRVFEYGGSFTKKPVTVTEQVVAKWDDVLVLDLVLDEDSHQTALRVRTKNDEIVKVSRVGDHGEEPGTLADYDAFVKRTQVVPESNDALVGTEHTSCLVGEEQVDCDVSTYQVTMGGKQAKLTVTHSRKVPGCDVGGKIVADDGTVLYSARLVERGNEPPVVAAFAKLDADRPLEP
jgi:hypothetical protein